MKKHSKSDLVKNHHSMSNLKDDSVNEKIISIMQLNYAETQVDLTNLNEEEKELKLSKAHQVIENIAESLSAQGLLQNMLVTQLLGAHELQQKLLPYVSRSMHDPERGQYYINAISKISILFIQQVSLLQKLQGNSQQKVTVEHLHVSDGGNAIIGQVNAPSIKGGG